MQPFKLISTALLTVLVAAPQVFACVSFSPRPIAIAPAAGTRVGGWQITIASLFHDSLPNGYVSNWMDDDGAATLISLYVALKSAEADKVKSQTTNFFDALTLLQSTIANVTIALPDKTQRSLKRLGTSVQNLRTEISSGEASLTSAHLESFRTGVGQELKELMMDDLFGYKVVTTYKNGRVVEHRRVGIMQFDMAQEFLMAVDGLTARGCTDFTLK